MSDLDLAAVRAFVTAVDEGQFGHAADVLGITQQGVSKRIAKLESHLGVRLFDRVPAGIEVTAAGLRVLPRARFLLSAADDVVAAVRSDPRPLRVAMLGERQSVWQTMRYYLDRNPRADIDIVMATPFRSSREALLIGRADAAFARPNGGPHPLPPDTDCAPAYLEPLHLLVGKNHPLAARSTVTPKEIVPHPVWVPGASIPSEWSDYYRDWSEFSGITILTGRTPAGVPEREDEYGGGGIMRWAAIQDHIAASDTLVTFTGDGFRSPWHPYLRRLSVVDPTPAYPHALLWTATNPHPALPPLIADIQKSYNGDIVPECWIPEPDRPIFLQ